MRGVSHENKKYYKARIRSLITQNSEITQRELQDRLTQEGLHLKYFGALVNGIHSVRARRANTWMPNHSLDSQQMMSEMAILRKRSEKELRTSLDIAAPEVVGNLNCCSSFIKSQVEAPF